MKSGLFLRLGALAGAAKLAVAECPNACSGHGTCGAYDMCSCYTGYMANDCSERVCPFGLAHVDSPKGDLDMDNDVEYATVIAGSQMYKDGTSELFPIMQSVSVTQRQRGRNVQVRLCLRRRSTCIVSRRAVCLSVVWVGGVGVCPKSALLVCFCAVCVQSHGTCTSHSDGVSILFLKKRDSQFVPTTVLRTGAPR